MPSQPLAHALKKALSTEGPGAPAPCDRAACIVVMGVGSELRRDDAAGVLVARALGDSPIEGIHVIDAGPVPENHTAEVKRLAPSLLVIVDCAHLGEPPGSVRVIDPSNVGGASFATHGLPLTVVADYLRSETGCRILILGIQPLSVDVGEGLSPAVAAAVDETVAALAQCLAGRRRGG